MNNKMINISDKENSSNNIDCASLSLEKIEELKDFKLSIRIGIAFAPKDGTTFMELYRHADQALYQTKRTGKNNYKICKNDEI